MRGADWSTVRLVCGGEEEEAVAAPNHPPLGEGLAAGLKEWSWGVWGDEVKPEAVLCEPPDHVREHSDEASSGAHGETEGSI